MLWDRISPPRPPARLFARLGRRLHCKPVSGSQPARPVRDRSARPAAAGTSLAADHSVHKVGRGAHRLVPAPLYSSSSPFQSFPFPPPWEEMGVGAPLSRRCL